MLNRLFIAAGLIVSTIAAPASAQGTPFGGGGGGGGGGPDNQKTVAPDPAASLRIHRDVRLVWRGNLPNDLRPLQQRVAENVWVSGAGKKAMQELGLTEQTAKSAFKIDNGNGAESIRLTLTLPSDTQAARDAANRFFEGLAATVVPDAVHAWADQTNQLPLERVEMTCVRAQNEFGATREMAANQRRKIRDVADVIDPSPEAVRGATSRLEQERQRIQLELIGQNARMKALQEHVSKLADTAAKKVQDDPIAAELAQLVKAHEQAVARLAELQKRGGAAAAEVSSAETQLAEAKARLLERRETAARSAGSELLADLNKELITLSITIVENEARLEYVGQRLKAFAAAGDLVDGLEQLQAAVARAAKQLEDAENEQRLARRQAVVGPAFSASVRWDEPKLEQIPKDGKR